MTATATSPFTAAGRLLTLIDQPAFALAYGSHATGRHRPHSDLDLLYVGQTAPGPATLQQLTDQVIALHHASGLGLDTEVAYASKLHATSAELAAALTLAGFTTGGQVTIPAVPADPVYLNSPVFKARLLLNALTGPHVFLAGDTRRYRACRRAAERAVLLLAVLLTGDADTLDIDQAVHALITDPHTAASGEDFLGYDPLDRAWLCGMLNQTAADLADHRMLPRTRDGRYATDPRTRAHLTRHVLHHRVKP